MNSSDPNEQEKPGAIPQKRSAIVLLVDGLNPLFLSPHGCTWIESPGLDQLAAESVTFERAIAETIDSDGALLSTMTGIHPKSLDSGAPVLFQAITDCRGAGIETIWFSDKPEPPFPAEEVFDRVIRLETVPVFDTDDGSCSASEIAGTHLAKCFARVLVELPKQVTPFLCIVHLSSLTQIWDAPLPLREKHCEEDDPSALTEVTPPNRSGEFDPDEVLVVCQAYAAQIEVLDTCLEILMDEMRLDGLLENTMFCLAGLRGFPLGHQRQIGHSQSHIGSDATRVPLMIRLPDCENEVRFAIRTHQLATTSSLIEFVSDWLNINSTPGDNERGELRSIVAGDDRAGRQFSIVCSCDSRAIWTPSWLLINRDGKNQLFVKPDDRWDVNPIQDRCRWIADGLLEVLENACIQLDRNEPLSVEPLADELVLGL